MAIFITGDMHGEMGVDKLLPANFDDRGLTRDDYVIVLGDFGFPWVAGEGDKDKYWLDWFELRPWTLLFIDGNHENFDALGAYPVEGRLGGTVHRLRENVFHLQRGQVYEIDGRAFFAMGGAYSIDKAWRTPGLDWWPGEVPGAEERACASRRVEEVGRVDYVLSHCPPTRELYALGIEAGFDAKPDMYTNWLQTEVADRLEFEQWFYGHMHVDRWSRRPFTPLFDAIYDLDRTGRTPFAPAWGRSPFE